MSAIFGWHAKESLSAGFVETAFERMAELAEREWRWNGIFDKKDCAVLAVALQGGDDASLRLLASRIRNTDDTVLFEDPLRKHFVTIRGVVEGRKNLPSWFRRIGLNEITAPLCFAEITSHQYKRESHRDFCAPAGVTRHLAGAIVGSISDFIQQPEVVWRFPNRRDTSRDGLLFIDFIDEMLGKTRSVAEALFPLLYQHYAIYSVFQDRANQQTALINSGKNTTPYLYAAEKDSGMVFASRSEMFPPEWGLGRAFPLPIGVLGLYPDHNGKLMVTD